MWYLDIKFPQKRLLCKSYSIPISTISNSSLTRYNTGISISGFWILEVNRVVEYVRSTPDPTSELARLCRIAGVSERTLQYAFKERYGIPPNVFVKKMEPELSSTSFAASRPGRDKRQRYCIETWLPSSRTVRRRIQNAFCGTSFKDTCQVSRDSPVILWVANSQLLLKYDDLDSLAPERHLSYPSLP